MASQIPLTETLRRTAFRLSRPDILFWTLPLLMVVLVAGTIAQKEMGLYAAQSKFFSSFIVWFGPIPFPGGYSLMGVFFINLLMKFLLFSEWAWHKSGIILTHFGVLLLVMGGLFTALTEREGSMVIGQGETVSIADDYNQRELRIIDEGGQTVLSLPHDNLYAGQVISGLPFPMRIDTYCFNCDIKPRADTAQNGWTTPGKFMQLVAAKPFPEYEQNMTGIEFTANDKKYVTFDKFPKPPVISHDGHDYTVMIGRKQIALPFSVTLTKFERDLHPGTDTAKAYRSDVTLQDGRDAWPATITMNEPLRYKGYTLYQSSFDLSQERPFTVLSVVKNTGRLFPYISSLIMACGLILHIVIRMKRRDES